MFVNTENINYTTQFCLGRISNGFGTTESREAWLKGNVYNFSYNANDKSHILNIRKYLMVKNSIR